MPQFTFPASAIISGTMASARLGSGGDGSGTHFLADDQTFKTIDLSSYMPKAGGTFTGDVDHGGHAINSVGSIVVKTSGRDFHIKPEGGNVRLILGENSDATSPNVVFSDDGGILMQAQNWNASFGGSGAIDITDDNGGFFITDAAGNVLIGATSGLTLQSPAVTATGSVTAVSFHGDGSSLTGLPSGATSSGTGLQKGDGAGGFAAFGSISGSDLTLPGSVRVNYPGYTTTPVQGIVVDGASSHSAFGLSVAGSPKVQFDCDASGNVAFNNLVGGQGIYIGNVGGLSAAQLHLRALAVVTNNNTLDDGSGNMAATGTGTFASLISPLLSTVSTDLTISPGGGGQIVCNSIILPKLGISGFNGNAYGFAEPGNVGNTARLRSAVAGTVILDDGSGGAANLAVTGNISTASGHVSASGQLIGFPSGGLGGNGENYFYNNTYWRNHSNAVTVTVEGETGVGTFASLNVGPNQVVGAQGAAVADATSALDVITQLNTLLARLRTHGLIAT